MSTDILLLGVLVGITLLGYMIAINSHGPKRLTVSYFLATVLLVFTTIAFIQHFTVRQEQVQRAQFRRLEQEKKEVEKKVQTQQETIIQSRQKMEIVTNLNTIINQGTGFALKARNINLKDFSVELDILMARAAQLNKSVSALSKKIELIPKKDKTSFPQTVKTLESAIKELIDAAKHYRLYYLSEDSAQEKLREQRMRKKAVNAYNLFKKAGVQVSASL